MTPIRPGSDGRARAVPSACRGAFPLIDVRLLSLVSALALAVPR